MQARLILALVLSSLFLAACGSSSNSSRAVEAPAATNDDGSAITGVITAIFNPSAGLIPTPNNLLFSGTRDLTLNIPVANPNNFGDPTVAINALDGFSTVAPWSLQFSATPNPATIIPGQTIRMFEVTLTGPGGGVTGVVRELTVPAEFVTAVAPSDPTGRTVAILPTSPLKQLTSYMVVVTDDVRDARGNDATQDQTYALASRTSPLCVNGVSTDPLLSDANACALEPLRLLTNSQQAAAGAVGIPRDEIAVTWVATTQSITPVLQTVRAGVQPTTTRLAFSGQTSAVVGLPPIADIYIGTIDLPYYLVPPSAGNPTGPLTGFWKAAPGAYVPPFNQFGLDPTSTHLTFANPRPVANTTVTAPLFVTVPNAASGRTKPASGWPVVIFQHGITRNRTDAVAISATLAAQGFAVVSIDQPLHGLPRSHPFNIENTPFGPLGSERTFDVDYINNTTGAPGPDGVPDPSGAHTINLASLLTSRDNLRQAIADLFIVAADVPSMDIDANGSGDFDGARIQFVGQSLGAMVGTAFLALEPNVRVATLSVPGGGIARLLDGSATFGPRIRAGLAAAAGLQPGTPGYDRFFFAAQTVIDSGDPINFGFASAQNAILLHEVVGSDTSPPDQVIPNSVPGAPLSGTEPLIRALGLSSITGTTQNANGIRGAVRFIAGHHGSLLSPSATGGTPTATELAVTTEMQGEMASMAVSNGTTVLVQNPSVIRTQ